VIEIVVVPANEALAIPVIPSIAAVMPLPWTIIPSILATTAPADILTTIPIPTGILPTTAAADIPTTITPTGILTPATYTADVSATTTSTGVMATATTPGNVASGPAAAAKVATASTHATEVATSTTTSTKATATATAATATHECDIALSRAKRSFQIGNAGVCLPHDHRGKKQAARKSSYCSNSHEGHLLSR
jgi:hypothetical protein